MDGGTGVKEGGRGGGEGRNGRMEGRREEGLGDGRKRRLKWDMLKNIIMHTHRFIQKYPPSKIAV